MEKLFSVPFWDARERKHVAAVRAATPEDAIRLVTAYQEQYGGFLYAIPPEVKDVVEINPDPGEPVQILWHQDYD